MSLSNDTGSLGRMVGEMTGPVTPNRQAPIGRVCATDDCDVVLSRYNPTAKCSVHADVDEPRVGPTLWKIPEPDRPVLWQLPDRGPDCELCGGPKKNKLAKTCGNQCPEKVRRRNRQCPICSEPLKHLKATTCGDWECRAAMKRLKATTGTADSVSAPTG